jgi:putative flippase GtrA
MSRNAWRAQLALVAQTLLELGRKHISNKQLQRYFVMAVVVVSVEYLSYLAMLWAGLHYLLAVVFSMAIGIVLNWYFSRVFVFKNRRHAPHKEFLLVLIASLVGVGIQLAVSFILVSILLLSAAFAKLAAIVVTFFWNYWVRKKHIF